MARRKKTTHMLLIEAQNNRDIQEIMLSEFERFGTEKAAADMLNITQQTKGQKLSPCIIVMGEVVGLRPYLQP